MQSSWELNMQVLKQVPNFNGKDTIRTNVPVNMDLQKWGGNNNYALKSDF